MNEYKIEVLRTKEHIYYAVFYEGDDVIFNTKEEAQQFIDSLERSGS